MSGRVEAVPVTELIASASADVRYIYVIHEEDDPTRCKVGRARHPQWRREELQAGNRRRLVLAYVWRIQGSNNTGVFERAIHDRLAPHHVSGEWFRQTPDRIAHVAEQIFLEFEI